MRRNSAKWVANAWCIRLTGKSRGFPCNRSKRAGLRERRPFTRFDENRAPLRRALVRALAKNLGFSTARIEHTMYESFYGLKWRPFAAAPDPASCVAVGSMRQVLPPMRRCVEAGQGIAILTAPAGMGKSLTVRRLLAELKNSFATIFLANSNFPSRRAFLQTLLYELGQPYTNMDEQELRLSLVSAARTVVSNKAAVLLAVDEAHLLDEKILDEIRAVTNLVEEGEPLVRVVLSGQLQFEEKLADPAFGALNQRVGCHVTLEPLSRAESSEYITQRLKWAGADVARIFTNEAVQAICQAADGVPQLINHLCDHCLLLGYVAEMRPIDQTIVLEALEDLRQLPLHWNELSAPSSTASTPAPASRRDLYVQTAEGFCIHRDWRRRSGRVIGSRLQLSRQRLPVDAAGRPSLRRWRFNSHRIRSRCRNLGRGRNASDPLEADDFYVSEESDWIDVSSSSDRAAGGLDNEFIVADSPECDPEWMSNNVQQSSGGFEEEVVFDRYAMLDAGQESAFDRGMRATRGNVHTQSNTHLAPDGIIDGVNPMLDMALDTSEMRGGTEVEFALETGCVPTARRTAKPGRVGHSIFDQAAEPDIEDRIGATVLDTCLETHRGTSTINHSKGSPPTSTRHRTRPSAIRANHDRSRRTDCLAESPDTTL